MNTRPLPLALIIVLLTTALISLSPVVPNGEGAEPEPGTPPYTPLILSEHPYNKALRLYSPPSSTLSILYDQWTFIIFGGPGDAYTIRISDAVAFSGNLTRQYLNLSYNANGINTARVEMTVGNRTYLWSSVYVNHQEMDLSGVIQQDADKQYSHNDILRAKLKTGFGVILATLITIPFVRIAVRAWRNRQGVRVW